MSDISDFIIKNKVVFFDGAMGTEIDRRGLDISKGVMKYNMTDAEVIKNIHKEYLKVGADIIATNTLTANELNLKDSGYTSKEIIEKAVDIAKESIKGLNNKFIALDIGPASYLIKENNNKNEILYDLFKEQVKIGEKSGVDCILVESMYTLEEAEVAVKAAKENSSLPVFCTVVLNEKGETFDGKDIKEIVETLEKNEGSGLGINCTEVSDGLMKAAEELLEYTDLPVIIQPNMGIPKKVHNEKVFNVSVDEYTDFMVKLYQKGLRIVGGCCGTTPEHLSKVKQNIDEPVNN